MPNTKKYVSLDKLTKYDELLKAKMAADDAKVLSDGKDYSDSLAVNYEKSGTVATAKQELQGNIDSLANGAVAQNTAAIAKLNGDANTTGSVAKAVADSAATLQAAIDAVDDKVDTNAAAIGVLEGQVDALIAGTYDDTEVRNLIQANADTIDALEETHATDKGTLEDAIALKADQTALDVVSGVANAAVKQTDYNTKVAALEAEDARIAGLVASEAERAADVEADFEERIAKMEVFWDVTEDSDGVVNKLKEIQDYIAGDETGAAEMAGNIQANTQAIEAMDKAYKEADTALQNAIDLKADASVLEILDGRVEELEGVSATHALKTEVQAVSDALTAYEDVHAGDYTNSQIDAAIKVNTDAIAKLNDTYASDEELAQAIADAKTDASNKDAVVLAEAQKVATAVQAALDTHIGNGDIHVTAEQKNTWTTAAGKAHEHSNLSVLGGVTAEKVTAWDKISAKADQTALQAEIERATAAEQTNAAAIAAFIEVSEEEVLALFN